MVMLGWSVKITTLLLGRFRPPKQWPLALKSDALVTALCGQAVLVILKCALYMNYLYRGLETSFLKTGSYLITENHYTSTFHEYTCLVHITLQLNSCKKAD